MLCNLAGIIFINFILTAWGLNFYSLCHSEANKFRSAKSWSPLRKYASLQGETQNLVNNIALQSLQYSAMLRSLARSQHNTHNGTHPNVSLRSDNARIQPISKHLKPNYVTSIPLNTTLNSNKKTVKQSLKSIEKNSGPPTLKLSRSDISSNEEELSPIIFSSPEDLTSTLQSASRMGCAVAKNPSGGAFIVIKLVP